MNKQNHKVYWEKQGGDMLCAVHTINSLLQGPFFDQVQLATIALELDRKQKQLMQQQGMTKDFLQYMQQQSGNVAMSGNYSIQVIVQALKYHKLQMIPIKTMKNEDLTNKTGFICNSQAHWFSLRKIDNIWYNLNSTNKRLPQVISDFYLSAFLDSVQHVGYQIFSVQGTYPQSSQQLFQHYNKHQQWFQVKRIQSYHQKRSKRKGYKPNISGAGDDKEMEKAIAASLGKKYQQEISSGEDEDWDQPQGKKKIKEFAGNAAYITNDKVFVDYANFQFAYEDPQIVMAIRVSLDQTFLQQPKQGISVAFRYPSGKKQRRIFAEDSLVCSLYDFIWRNRDPTSLFYLVNSQSKEKLLDVTIPINAIAEDGDVTVFITDI